MTFTAVTLFSYIVICYTGKPSGLPYRIGLFSADADWQWIQYFAPVAYADSHLWSKLQTHVDSKFWDPHISGQHSCRS